MAREWRRVRCVRHIPVIPITECEVGEILELPEEQAIQLERVGAVEYVRDGPRVEAAALAGPRRRG